MEDELNESSAAEDAKADPTRPEFYATVNHEDEYQGMLLQTGYHSHSANWDQMVDEKAAEMEDELNESSAAEDAKADPTRPEFYAKDKSEMYDDMLLQRHSALWEQ